MNPNPRNSSRASFLSPSTSSSNTAATENLSDSSKLPVRNPSTPSTSGSYSQYYPLESNYAGQDEDEDEVDTSMDPQQRTAHQINQLMRTNRPSADDSSSRRLRSQTGAGDSNIQPDDMSSQQSQPLQQQTSQTSSDRRYGSRLSQQQLHQRQLPASPVLSQQRRLPPFSPTTQNAPHTSSQLVRAATTTLSGQQQQHRDSTSSSLLGDSSSTIVSPGGSLDFQKLISVLERRERRLESESAKRLELEKRRFEFTELMEQKRLEIEQTRYNAEKERSKRIENILMSLVSRAGGSGGKGGSTTAPLLTGLASVAGTSAGGKNADDPSGSSDSVASGSSS